VFYDFVVNGYSAADLVFAEVEEAGVVFLVGGVKALQQVMDSFAKTFSVWEKGE
jgi:hypothetical protein